MLIEYLEGLEDDTVISLAYYKDFYCDDCEMVYSAFFKGAVRDVPDSVKSLEVDMHFDSSLWVRHVFILKE